MNDEWLEGMDDYVDGDTALAEALDIPPADVAPTHLVEYEEDDYHPDDYHPQMVSPWTTALVFDVALGLESDETLLARHGITLAEWRHINTHPLFLRQVAEQAREIGENGISFRAKAKIQAEMYLKDIDQMIASQSTDQKVRLEAIRSMVKWAGLEPTPNKEEGSNVPQVNIQINM